jgi:hypothetical protein
MLEFGRWDVAAIAVRASRAVQAHLAEGRKFEVLDRSPWPRVCGSTDAFGLVVTVHGLGEGIVAAGADGSDGRRGAALGDRSITAIITKCCDLQLNPPWLPSSM